MPDAAADSSKPAENAHVPGPGGPPLDKDGKPIPPPPPPPIIGPDGKELPRPRDAQGRPMPIYVTEKGEPVLDQGGNPIPLRFDQEGRPMPLDQPSSQGQGQGQAYVPGVGQNSSTSSKSEVPMWLQCFAGGDALVSLGLCIYTGYEYGTVTSSKEGYEYSYAINSSKAMLATCIITGLSVFLGAILLAKKLKIVMNIWTTLAILILIGQFAIPFALDGTGYWVIWLAVVVDVIRICVTLFGCLCLHHTEGPPQTTNSYYPVSGSGYNNYGGGGTPSTNYVDPNALRQYNNKLENQVQQKIQADQAAAAAAPPAQTPSQPQTVVVVQQTPAYQPMGYGYGGYPFYGGGYPYGYPMGGYGMGMGMANPFFFDYGFW